MLEGYTEKGQFSSVASYKTFKLQDIVGKES